MGEQMKFTIEGKFGDPKPNQTFLFYISIIRSNSIQPHMCNRIPEKLPKY